MTMKVAFECEDNDIPFIEDGFNHEDRHHKKELLGLFDGDSRLSVDDALSDQWQVIKAEPKVLTAEEWVDYILQLEQATQTYKELIKNSEQPPKRLPYIIKRVAKDSFDEGDKNGQLRERNRLSPLIKACEKAIELTGPIYVSVIKDLELELNKIKPPHQP